MRNQFERRRFDPIRRFGLIEIMIALAFVAILSCIVVSAVETVRHGGCAKFEFTNRLSCTQVGMHSTCEQEQICTRYKDGTTP